MIDRTLSTQNLVFELQKSHFALRELLGQIIPNSRSYKSSKSIFPALHNQVLSYFERQNTVPYDSLIAIYADDRVSLKTIEYLRYDLRDLKVRFLEFFEKYLSDHGERFAGCFAREYSGFAESLCARIDNDQVLLFPLLMKWKLRNDLESSSQKTIVFPIA